MKNAEIKSILAIGADILPKTERGGNRVSIYKPEIMSDDLSKSERNSIRKQLRKKLDQFIKATTSSKEDESKMKEIRSAWKQYATQVYVNPSVIIESNAGEERQKLVNEFLSLVSPKKVTLPKKG